MKKSLVALAILAAAGVASAQSSVTLFGVVDAAYTHGSGSGVGSADKSRLTNSGYNSSRIGFRGTEDLGGGMSASFWLEAGINNDDGSGQASNSNNQTNGGLTVAGAPATPAVAALNGSQGLTFNRRSTVSLASGLGELRLGRDYSPQFWNQTVFDPFGTVGVGTTQTLSGTAAANLGGTTTVRASNSIGYFLPGNLGGFYGQFQHYLGENDQNGAATEDDGKGSAIRLGYANGPVNVALATSTTKFATTAATGDTKSTNLGGSWDFGVAQVMALATRDRREQTTSVTGKGYLLGGLIPVGAGQIRVSVSQYKVDTAAAPKSRKIALGYVHNLSKRTALYTTFARVSNSGGATAALGGATTAANERSTGYDFGIKHSF